MSRIQTQATSDAYGSALNIAAGTTQIEVSFLDSGALVAGTVKVEDPDSNVMEIAIGANQSYVFNLRLGSTGWSVKLKAGSGTPTGQLLET